MSDVSPLRSSFPALRNQIPVTPTTSPPVPTSPAPVLPADSFPLSSSPAHRRPSPALFRSRSDVDSPLPFLALLRSRSDVSPLPSTFPALRFQIPATPTTSPPVPTSPAPVPPAVKISPENNMACPASETVSTSLDPNPDSDPPTEEVMAKELRTLREQQVEPNRGMERIAETLKGKVVLEGALTENNDNNASNNNNNNNNNNTASQELRRLSEQQVELNKRMERIEETLKGKFVLGGADDDDDDDDNNTASQVHEDLTIGSGGEELGMSFACRCGWSITFGSDGEKQQLKFVCLCGRFHNFVYMSQ